MRRRVLLVVVMVTAVAFTIVVAGYASYRATQAEMQQKVTKLEADNQALSRQNGSLQSKVSANQREVAQVQAEYARVSRNESDAVARAQALQAENDKLRTHSDNMKGLIVSVQADARVARASFDGFLADVGTGRGPFGSCTDLPSSVPITTRNACFGVEQGFDSIDTTLGRATGQ